MGMTGGLCQNILDDTLGEFSGTLILLHDDQNLKPGFDSGTIDFSHTSAEFLIFKM